MPQYVKQNKEMQRSKTLNPQDFDADFTHRW